MSNDLMKIGGLGAIGLMGAAIVATVAMVMYNTSYIDYGYAAEGLDYGEGITWACSMGLIAIGVLGLSNRYWGEFPNKIFIFAVLVLALGLIARIILWVDGTPLNSIVASPEDLKFVGLGDNFIEALGAAGIIWFELNGLFLILLGSGINKIKASTGIPGVASRTAGLLILTGILFCLMIPFAYAVTQAVAILAMIMLAYLLFKAN